MSMPWPDVDGKFMCTYNYEMREMMSLNEGERKVVLYPWRAEMDSYISHAEDSHAVILTGSNQRGGWQPYFAWKKEDYTLKFPGDQDPLWFDPEGNPTDMIVSWRGLTTRMRPTSYKGDKPNWQSFVERCGRLLKQFDTCSMPAFLNDILTFEAPITLESFTIDLDLIGMSDEDMARWRIRYEAGHGVPGDANSTRRKLKFIDGMDPERIEIITPRISKATTLKVKESTMPVSTLPLPPNIAEDGETFRVLAQQLSNLNLSAPAAPHLDEGRLFRDPTPRPGLSPRDEGNDYRIPFLRASGILAKLTDFPVGATYSLLCAGRLLHTAEQMGKRIPDSWCGISHGLGHEPPEAAVLLQNALERVRDYLQGYPSILSELHTYGH